MRKLLALAWTVAAARACGSPKGGPTDAPTATLFGAGSFAWAESMLPWHCVYNVRDFPAPSAESSFYEAQAAAVAGGGGVVYFPAGAYKFSWHLLLNSSVAIRGEPTTARAKAGKLPGPLAPATRFSFPDRMHFGILNLDPAADALAVVNVAFEFGSIMLWPGLLPAPPSAAELPWPGSLKSYWYEATSVVGAGRNKLVLSNTFSSVAFGGTDPTNPSSNPWAFRFSHAIAVYADENSLVANNLLPFSPAGPEVTIKLEGDKNPSETLPFPYDLRYGVDNKLLYGAVAGAAVAPGGACGGGGWGSLDPLCGSFIRLRPVPLTCCRRLTLIAPRPLHISPLSPLPPNPSPLHVSPQCECGRKFRGELRQSCVQPGLRMCRWWRRKPTAGRRCASSRQPQRALR